MPRARLSRPRLLVTAAVSATIAAVALTAAPAASARPAPRPAPPSPAHLSGFGHHVSSTLGDTRVTTAPGVASTLLKAGIAPLPVLPKTGFGVSFRNGVQVSYTFPITKNTADLKTGTGDILHSGGIYFVGRKGSLEIGRFDIDLAAGKVYATEVNFAPGRVAVLDLNLSGLKVSTGRGGSTVLSGITATLDGQAAGALNATFGTALPTDGSLAFGTATVTIR